MRKRIVSANQAAYLAGWLTIVVVEGQSVLGFAQLMSGSEIQANYR
jgi:hypothetical protein